MSTHTPTAEQTRIADMFRTGGTLRVRAGAGTGKTSVLVQLANILTEQNRIGLYIAFNSAIAKEAGRKMPPNMDSRTAHSLAYNAIRNHRTHAPLLTKMNTNGRVPFHLTRQRFNINSGGIYGADGEPRTISAFSLGRHAANTVEQFCKTADTELGPQHVPTMVGLDLPGHRTNHTKLTDMVMPYATAMWKDICDPRGAAVTFTHGHYLKLWALEQPTFGPTGAALFIDEAQDISPVVAGVIDQQKHLQIVVVGDENQAIYRFTGAGNYMAAFPAEHTGTLTQSWRFGQTIADEANRMLTQLGGTLQLTGNPNLASTVDRTYTGPCDAILTRTNGAALQQVIATQTAGRKVHLMADTKYALNFCKAADDLQTTGRTTFADLAAFDDWGQVCEYAEESSDASDWKVLIKLIDEHGHDQLQRALAGSVPEDQADVTVSTCHKGKGREFGRVHLDDSINDAIERVKTSDRPDRAAALRDEQMLAYVAITRAQHILNPGTLGQPTMQQPTPAYA